LFFQQRRFVIVGSTVGWRRIVFGRRSGLCSRPSVLSRRILRSYNNRQNEKAAGAHEQAVQVRCLQPSVLCETHHPAHHKVPPVAEPARPAGSLIRIAEELNLPPAYSRATPTSIPRRSTRSTGGCPNHVLTLWPIVRKQVSRSSACDLDSRLTPGARQVRIAPGSRTTKGPQRNRGSFQFSSNGLSAPVSRSTRKRETSAR
jgi:hypothetical protein